MSIISCGSETCKGLNEIEKSLRVLVSNCLWKIMHVKWYGHVTEEEVRA